MSATRKPARPSLPTSREQILVSGLPADTPPATKPPATTDVPPPAPYPGVRGYGQRPTTSTRRSTARRSDPPGMRRESYYVTQEAADAIDNAVTRIREALGGDIAKQVVLSALLIAGAERVNEVAARIADEQARLLATRLDALRHVTD